MSANAGMTEQIARVERSNDSPPADSRTIPGPSLVQSEGKLSEAEKVALWQQRFFEAQASVEEYLMELGGWSAIDDWIEANSSITARLLASREPAKENRAAFNVKRFVNQLRCYDSDISSQHDRESNSYTITNQDCGILRYRKTANTAGRVRLTFASPCEYCTKLNCKIIQKYVGASVEVKLRDGGCEWKVTPP